MLRSATTVASSSAAAAATAAATAAASFSASRAPCIGGTICSSLSSSTSSSSSWRGAAAAAPTSFCGHCFNLAHAASVVASSGCRRRSAASAAAAAAAAVPLSWTRLCRRRDGGVGTDSSVGASWGRSAGRRRYGAYAWGTSKNGIIPLPEALDDAGGDGMGEGSSSLSSSSSSSSPTLTPTPSALDRGAIVCDHPREIDVSAAFGASASRTGPPGGRPTLDRLVCGPTSSAAVLSDGSLWTWGDNAYGQLGHVAEREGGKPGDKAHAQNDSHAAAAAVPVKVVRRPAKVSFPPDTALDETGVRSISLGPYHSALIDGNGDLYTMGLGGSALNGAGMLCHGHDVAPKYRPTLVRSLVEDGVYASMVGCGELHTVVLTTEGETLTAGGASYGRLGNLDASGDQLYLEPVELLEKEVVTAIAVGHSFTLALDGEGVIYSWGRNDKGQLGLGAGLSVDIYAMEAMPSPIESQLEGRRVKKIAAGHSHAAAVTSDGELFVWGSGAFLEPQPFPSLLHSKIIDVACGQDYTIALSEDGRLYSVGKGRTGVLGLASVRKANQPTLVEGLASRRVVSMSAGYAHFACLVDVDQGEA